MRGDSNERLTILSDAENTALYGIPSFDDFQRIEFFAMTDAERSLALQRRGILKQVFLLAANWLLQGQAGVFSVLTG